MIGFSGSTLSDLDKKLVELVYKTKEIKFPLLR
jgi:hypothetical protein